MYDPDCGARSLYLAVNGKNQERVFFNLPSVTLYPTVVFYGKGRSVELLTCSLPTTFDKNFKSSLKIVRYVFCLFRASDRPV